MCLNTFQPWGWSKSFRKILQLKGTNPPKSKVGRKKHDQHVSTNSSTHKQRYTKQKTIQQVYCCVGPQTQKPKDTQIHQIPDLAISGRQRDTERERERKMGRWKHSKWIKLRFWDVTKKKQKSKNRFPHLFSTRPLFLLWQTKLRPAQLLAAPACVTLCQWHMNTNIDNHTS